jgi:hypothetical protein
MHLSRAESTLIRRTNSHRSATSTEHSNAVQRRQLNRTQSNASQLPQQRHSYRQHHRTTIEKTPSVIDRSPNSTTRHPPFERRSVHQTQNGIITSHQQRSKKPS